MVTLAARISDAEGRRLRRRLKPPTPLWLIGTRDRPDDLPQQFRVLLRSPPKHRPWDRQAMVCLLGYAELGLSPDEVHVAPLAPCGMLLESSLL
jgi:hypothetical protein